MKIGDEVVCIKPSYYNTNDKHPIVGKVYTIRSVSFGCYAFEEIINSVKIQSYRYGIIEEVHFNSDRFAPLHYNASAISELLEEPKTTTI